MLIKLKNKKGDFAVTLVVILSLALVGIALYSFNTSNRVFTSTINNPNILDEVYLQKDTGEFYLQNSMQNMYIKTFYDCVREDFCFAVSEKNKEGILVFDKVWNEEEKFNEKFKENLGTELGRYNSEILKIDNVKLSFSDNDNDISGQIENIDLKADIVDENVDSLSYKTNFDSSINVNELGLNSIKEISKAWELCNDINGVEEKQKCYEDKLGNFEGGVELIRKDGAGNILIEIKEDTQIAEAYTIISMKSKEKYFIEKEGEIIYSNIEMKFVDMKIEK